MTFNTTASAWNGAGSTFGFGPIQLCYNLHCRLKGTTIKCLLQRPVRQKNGAMIHRQRGMTGTYIKKKTREEMAEQSPRKVVRVKVLLWRSSMMAKGGWCLASLDNWKHSLFFPLSWQTMLIVKHVNHKNTSSTANDMRYTDIGFQNVGDSWDSRDSRAPRIHLKNTARFYAYFSFCRPPHFSLPY